MIERDVNNENMSKVECTIPLNDLACTDESMNSRMNIPDNTRTYNLSGLSDDQKYDEQYENQKIRGELLQC